MGDTFLREDLGGFPVSRAKLEDWLLYNGSAAAPALLSVARLAFFRQHLAMYVAQAALKLTILWSVTKKWDYYRHAQHSWFQKDSQCDWSSCLII